MKLVKVGAEYHLLSDYNTEDAYDYRIAKGSLFYKDELKDIVVAEYAPASKVSRPVIASTNLDFGTEIALLDKAKIKVLINKVDVHKLAENFVSKDGSFTKTHLNQTTWGFAHNGFVAGYEKCLEINADKKWTDDDLMNFYKYVKTHTVQESFTHIRSLKQTEWNVEVEMEDAVYSHKNCGNCNATGSFGHTPCTECKGYGSTMTTVSESKPKLTNGFVTIISIK